MIAGSCVEHDPVKHGDHFKIFPTNVAQIKNSKNFVDSKVSGKSKKGTASGYLQIYWETLPIHFPQYVEEIEVT